MRYIIYIDGRWYERKQLSSLRRKKRKNSCHLGPPARRRDRTSKRSNTSRIKLLQSFLSADVTRSDYCAQWTMFLLVHKRMESRLLNYFTVLLFFHLSRVLTKASLPEQHSLSIAQTELYWQTYYRLWGRERYVTAHWKHRFSNKNCVGIE